MRPTVCIPDRNAPDSMEVASRAFVNVDAMMLYRLGLTRSGFSVNEIYYLQ